MDISNGEGVGVALFVQGCSFNPHCKNCFNPETWDFNGGKEWTDIIKEKFIGLIDRSYIKRVSILGGEPLAEDNLDDVLDLVIEVNKQYNTSQYIDVNGGNKHNISSGNANEICLTLPQKSIWLYSGYTFESIIKDAVEVKDRASLIRYLILTNIDVLVDGKYIDSQRDISLKWRGSKNQKIIDVKKTLQQREVVLWCN